ncbi:hypothetical protein [Streptomyces olivochromogenes]|uniref:hypothetical protein n=1 Tax=Streptomyces olivochromogenes TaxID=1963 RepID=UPI001F469116|nr:hypothetical protein [Streptomyces olivochromogenes]MCF3131462.1 hypothetical protein [Streptomyces olivochromogenes]
MPDYIQSQHLVLRNHPADDRVEEYANAHGWPLVHEHEGIPGEEPMYIVWDIAPGLSLYYAEDEVAPISYVFVRSSTPEMASMALEAIRRDLNPWTVPEIIAAYGEATHPAAKARNLIRMAIGASREFTQDIIRCIDSALHEEDARLRGSGISAISYLMWPECRALLRDTARNDPDAITRQRALETLDEFDELGVDE